ncbi:MAG TPA: lysylphosphatidylglycerol synthase transmembrane domain-containing protein [Vicinamibacterales bacterium]|nr:lysylphosphatidylglycerol synthase transmembrane domain-containing protein [Vicinamibacterales bacterium]
MPSRLRAVLVLLLTVGLLAFFLRGVNLAGVWAETRHADARLLAVAVSATMLTYALRAFRWQYLLAPIGPTRFSTAFQTTTIGFAASFLLPARAGEVLRPYLLARREHLPPTAAFATIILERLLDLVTVLLLFGVFILVVEPASLSADPAVYAKVKAGGLLAAAASVAGLIVFFALAGHPERLGRFALRIERVLPAKLARIVARFVETFAQGLAVMRQPVRLLVSLILSFPLWLSIAAGIWITSRAFHMTFGYLGSFLVMTLLVVGVAAPTPGSVGGFHAMYKYAVVTFFGVANDRAVGAAIVLHAVSFVPVTLLGLIFMAREGLSFGRMREMADRDSNDGTSQDVTVRKAAR